MSFQTAALFPRGLVQPEGSFRFAADALLLAAFANADSAELAADLGTGCGVVAFGLALRFPLLQCVGIERNAELVEAARQNARAFGCAERVIFEPGDLADRGCIARLGRESFILVTANPPYRLSGSGRPARSTSRQNALAAPEGGLDVFARAGSALLRNHGRFACVFSPGRLGDLFAALRASRLEPRRLLAVHPRWGAPASCVLVEARKNARPDLRIDAPLVLYDTIKRKFSSEALRFCPWRA
jgi:tRNA1(Val) A37 N6-methylase TrmN6